MPFDRIAILGVGLLGGSIGLAAKRVQPACKIVGYGHRTSTLDRARQLGAIDEAATDLQQAVNGAELIVLCTPVGLFKSILAQIGSVLRDGAIVTDVGSTKRSVARAAEEALSKSVHFVGSHPMAGSEKRGVEFARVDLFQQATCITTPTDRTNADALAKVEAFWQSLGMRIARLSPEDHDRLLARVSHLPHAIAAALATIQCDQTLAFAGKGFFDTTRIAAGDAGLWRDIFLDNRDNLKQSLKLIREEIDRLDRMIDANDQTGIQTWLERAAAQRDSKNT